MKKTIAAALAALTLTGVAGAGQAAGQNTLPEASDARCYSDWSSWTMPDGTHIEGAVDYVERILGNKIERLQMEVRWRGTRIKRFRRELRRERAAHRAQVQRLRAWIRDLEAGR